MGTGLEVRADDGVSEVASRTRNDHAAALEVEHGSSHA
jgi:hypothetical protein